MKKVGGSDVAQIVGLSPYGSAYAVWERIMHGGERADTPALSRGRRLEPVVLDWYAEQTGRRLVRGVGLRDKTRPHLRGSVEAKTAGASETHRWGDDGTDAIPSEYLCQTIWYLGFGRDVRVVGDEVADVPALIAGDFRMYVVRFDADVYGELRDRVERFWVDHVLTGRPPDVTSLPNDVEAIKRRFPRHETSEHLDFGALPPESQVVLEEYLRAYAEQAEATDRLALWETKAKLLVGNAPGVKWLPRETGVYRIDWEAHEKGKTAWKKVAEELAKQHGVNPAALKALAEKHAGEAARPFTPRAITKKGTR
jgi:hypothetical protein